MDRKIKVMQLDEDSELVEDSERDYQVSSNDSEASIEKDVAAVLADYLETTWIDGFTLELTIHLQWEQDSVVMIDRRREAPRNRKK